MRCTKQNVRKKKNVPNEQSKYGHKEKDQKIEVDNRLLNLVTEI